MSITSEWKQGFEVCAQVEERRQKSELLFPDINRSMITVLVQSALHKRVNASLQVLLTRAEIRDRGVENMKF